MLSISIARRLRCRRDSPALRDPCVKGRRWRGGKLHGAAADITAAKNGKRRRHLRLQQHSSAARKKHTTEICRLR